MAVERQQRQQHVARVGVVLHDEDPARRHARLAPAGVVGDGGARDGQPDREHAALPRARAARLHAAAVKLDELADQREPDAEAARGPLRRLIALHEEVEDARQQVGAHAHAAVAHAQQGLAALDAGPDADGAAGGRELERVADEVGDDLLQPRGVPGHPHRAAVDRDVVTLGDARRAQGGHGAPRGGQQVHGTGLEDDLAGHHAPDVEQVVHQPREVLGLPGDDLGGPRTAQVVDAQALQHGHRAADGAQRIAQLMAEHGQELVLRAVRALRRRARGHQLGLVRLALGDVDADADARAVGESHVGPRGLHDAAALRRHLEIEPARLRRLHVPAHHGAVLGIGVAGGHEVDALGLGGRPARHALEFAVEPQHARVGGEHRDHGRDRVDDRLQQLALVVERLLGAHARGHLHHARRGARHAPAAVQDRTVDQREVALTFFGGAVGQRHTQRVHGDGPARGVHPLQQRLQQVGRRVAEHLAHRAPAMRARSQAVHLGQRAVDADVPEIGVVDGQTQRRVAQEQIHAVARAVARGHQEAHGDAGADEEGERDHVSLGADRRRHEPGACDEERGQDRREQPGSHAGKPRDEHDRGIERHERNAPAPHGIEGGVQQDRQQHGEHREAVAAHEPASRRHVLPRIEAEPSPAQ